MKTNYLKKLNISDSPGIYIFRDSKKMPLYIGRATCLRDRVKSYFDNDLIVTRGPRIVDMVSRADSLTYEETDSVLEAILLESKLIKRYQPKYNVDEKDDKSNQCVVITEEEWPRVFLERARDFELKKKEGKLEYKVRNVFGPYQNGAIIKSALGILRKLFPFRDKKANDPRHDSFYRSIGRSPTGTVSFTSPTTFPRDESHRAAKSRGNVSASFRDCSRMNDDGYYTDYGMAQYKKTIDYLVLFFEGKKSLIKKKIKTEMEEYSRKQEFEKANEAKKLLFALDHIRDIALIKREEKSGGNDFRIEAYDIAHLSGTNVVGAMVVSIDGKLVKSEYRKFKISKEKNDDIRALAEVLNRRLNHSEWTFPDLIVVDGNEMQMKVAESILSVRRMNIPVVAVTKNEKHKVREVLGSKEIVKSKENEIIVLNNEAHRFVIAYHRRLRNRIY